jgi:hypothetical protein
MMKILLWVDEEGEMHFDSMNAREYVLELIGDREPQRTNVLKLKNAKLFAKQFFAVAAECATSEETVEFFRQ